MDGQSVGSGRTVFIRTRRRSVDLTPRELVARLVHARRLAGNEATYSDYCAARAGHPDIDSGEFTELLASAEGDPGFTWQEHVFQPSLQDSAGRMYEILERFPDRIRLLRDDGMPGYTTPEEFDSFFSRLVTRKWSRATQEDDRLKPTTKVIRRTHEQPKRPDD